MHLLNSKVCSRKSLRDKEDSNMGKKLNLQSPLNKKLKVPSATGESNTIPMGKTTLKQPNLKKNRFNREK